MVHTVINGRGLRISIVALFIVALLAVGFLTFVHNSFQGLIWGPLLPGAYWGVPPSVDVVPLDYIGWDGQFYFYESQDPLILSDIFKYIDAPGYRYKRVFVPLAACIISRLLGFSTTLPAVYFIVHFLLVAGGVFCMTYWLAERKYGFFWILGWICGYGTLTSLFHGLMDASAESLLLISIYMFCHGRFVGYATTATMMLLTRETFLPIPLALLAISIWNDRVKRGGDGKPSRRTLCLTIPIFVMGFWHCYVAFKLGAPELSWGHNLDYPLRGYWLQLMRSLEWGIMQDIFFRLYFGFAAGGILYLSFQRIGSHEIYFAIFLFAFTLLCTGPNIWNKYWDYARVGGVVFALFAIILALEGSLLSRCMLLTNIFIGATFTYQINFAQADVATRFVGTSTSLVQKKILNNIEGSVDVRNVQEVYKIPKSFWSPLHRSARTLEFEVSNYGSEDWSSNGSDWRYNIGLLYEWRTLESIGIVLRGTIPLPETVSARSKLVFQSEIGMPGRPGNYILSLSVVQGRKFSYIRNQGTSTSYEVEVRYDE